MVQHKHFVILIQQIYSFYTANTKVVQIGGCQILEENHENGSETGPHGSVRADRMPPGPQNTTEKSRNPGFPGFPIFSHIFLSFLNSSMPALFPLRGPKGSAAWPKALNY